jgi:TPP-dependent pyruvate/acetoin dehydrogenase alpha subunit
LPSPHDVTDTDLDAPINLEGRDLDQAVDLFGRMVLIREFEQRVNKLFLQGRIPGTIHLSVGQEACAVGATSQLRAEDWITITHRGHGQAIAKGVTVRSMMAELFARDTGCCRGYGGSLHVGDISVGAVPGIAIVGAAVPIAAGIGYAFREQHTDRVALSFMGDGSFGEGDTHEGLNLASLWNLPVIYLCENNGYSISTPLHRQMRAERVAEWAAGYRMTATTVDGNNVFAVHDAVLGAVERARQGEGPTLVECLTYRQGGHKRDDPATYRPPDEVKAWLARDPIKRLRASLMDADRSTAVDKAEQSARDAIDDAVDFAEHSAPAAPDVI